MKKIFILLLLLSFMFSCCNSKKMVKDTKITVDSVYVEKGQWDTDGDGVIDKDDEMPDILKGLKGEKSKPIIIDPAPKIQKVKFKIITPPTQEQIIDNTLKSISTGEINYVIQDTMIVGQTNVVNMTISNGVDREKIISQIKTFNENNVHSEAIRISTTMRARLIDPTDGANFKIISTTQEEQFLEDNDYTKWSWNVTPITKGTNRLDLSVDIVVGDKSKNIKVYDGFIYVYSDETIWDKMINFFLENWEWIASTLLIPLGIYLFDKFKKKKKK